MKILNSNEERILNDLLTFGEISTIATERSGFWRKHVNNSIDFLKGVSTESAESVEVSLRDYLSFAAGALMPLLNKLPIEKNLLMVIKSLEYHHHQVRKIVFYELKDLKIHVGETLDFNRKVFFLFLANAYE
jgi:hypothetical protein